MSPEEGYNLQKSKKAVSELYPVIKDAHGNVIDGFHRLDADPNWKTETIATITTPLQLALARIVANTHRRSINKEERKLQLVAVAEELVKEGLAREQVIPAMAELTTFSEDYLRRMLPDEYKQRPGVGGGAHESVGLSPTHQHVADESGVTCKICGRPLTAPESVAAGIGPICATGQTKPIEGIIQDPSVALISQEQIRPLTLEEKAYALLNDLHTRFGQPSRSFMIETLRYQLHIYLPDSDNLIAKYKARAAKPTEPQPTPTKKHEPTEIVVEIRVDGVCIQGYPVKLAPGQKLEIRVDGDTVHTETAPAGEAPAAGPCEEATEPEEDEGKKIDWAKVEEIDEKEDEEHDTEEEHPHQPTGPEEAP